jgi:hypothetical protein
VCLLLFFFTGELSNLWNLLLPTVLRKERSLVVKVFQTSKNFPRTSTDAGPQTDS